MKDNDRLLHAALRKGRMAVDGYVRDSRAAFQEWTEETATEMLSIGVAPHVVTIKTSRAQESRMGADWLWWWIDSDGVCFGMLSQAKRMHGRRGSRKLDFLYANKNGRQLNLLMKAASDLQVPAVYALYFGPPEDRPDLVCGDHDEECGRCDLAGVSILTALEAWEISMHPEVAASQSFAQATPLERLPFFHGNGHAQFWYRSLLREGSFTPGLDDFLKHPQKGASAAARALLDAVTYRRIFQFSAPSSVSVDMGSAPRFPRVPSDRGHFGVPYFEHILNGLRSAPPAYVMELLSGYPVPSWLHTQVDGVVLVRC